MRAKRGQRSWVRAAVIGAAVLVTACGDGRDAASDTTLPVDTVAVPAATVVAPTTVPATTSSTLPPLTTDDVLTTGGLGEVRIGMTLGEAEVASGRLFDSAPGVAEQECFVATPRNLPGVEVVVAEDRIRVIDVTDRSITTRSGAAVGLEADAIRELFGERIDETPIDAVEALTFVPADAADQDKRVVFFTDGATVTRMMSGTLPHVLRVDPCAGSDG